LTLILIAIWILYEAVQRFQHPEPIQPLVMFLSAGIGIVVNLYIGFGLQKEKDNLNMRAAALHVFGDVGASVAVIVAGLIILFTGWTPADPPALGRHCRTHCGGGMADSTGDDRYSVGSVSQRHRDACTGTGYETGSWDCGCA